MISSGTLRNRSARLRSNAFSVFALFCYVVSSGIVPAGFMAAPVSSGTAFHLCPGDALSAVVISKLMGSHEHHHHHAKADGAEGPSADVGCAFSASAGALALESNSLPEDTLQDTAFTVLQSTSYRYSYAWARPPVRSPPA